MNHRLLRKGRVRPLLVCLALLGSACGVATSQQADKAQAAKQKARHGGSPSATTGDTAASGAGGAAGGQGAGGGAGGPGGVAAGANGGGAGAGSTRPGSATTGPGKSGGGGGGAGGGAAAIVNDQGITPTKIKIGFILPAGNPGAAFGINSPNSDPNSARTLVDAMVKDVNQRGGIAGRTVEAAYVDNDNTDNSQKTQTDKQEQSCRTLTEGSKVFMAVALNVGGLPFGHACFAREGVPLIDRELTFETDASMAQLRPWVIAPTGMTLTRVAKLLPATLAEQGFLTKSMAVIAYDVPTTRQVTEEVLIPEIQKRGGAVIDKVYSAVSYEDLGRQMSAAVLRFNGRVDRVLFMAPGGGAPLLFTKQADAQRYYPLLGVTTLDCPGPCLTPFDAASVPKRSMVGAIGVGYVPLYDTGGYDPWANPTPRMRACWDAANRATGSSYPGPLGTQFVLQTCDLLNFAQQALAPAANRTLLRPQVADQVAALGSGFASMFTPKTRFAGDRLAGAAAVAPLRFDDDCGGNGTGCWKYSGPFKDSPF